MIFLISPTIWPYERTNELITDVDLSYKSFVNSLRTCDCGCSCARRGQYQTDSGDEGVVCGNITIASDTLPYEFVIRKSGWNTSSIADAPPGTVANHLHGYSAFQIGSAVTALFISQNESY